MEVSFIRGWALEQALGEKKGMRGLLFSPGSMTLDLESLFGSQTLAEVKSTRRRGLEEGEAAYLEEKPGMDALERVVWLSVAGRKLVCAVTLVPADRVEGWLLKNLEDRSTEPIGKILTSRNIAFSKEKIEAGVVRCREVSRDLGIPEETPLLARKYVLRSTRPGGGLVMKASVVEIFSPEIIRAGDEDTEIKR